MAMYFENKKPEEKTFFSSRNKIKPTPNEYTWARKQSKEMSTPIEFMIFLLNYYYKYIFLQLISPGSAVLII